MRIKKIGVITSGGDCGGLNAVIKGIAQTAVSHGLEAYVIPHGYAGLYNLIDIGNLTKLTPSRTYDIYASLAGSEAGHSRVNVSKINDAQKYERIKQGLIRHKIDALIISGGNDTGSVVVDLCRHGIPCIHVPKTMDLDLQPYSVGADSAINRIAKFVRDLRTTVKTHSRMLVVEVYGRHAGHTAFRGGVAAEADCILIPEIPVNFDIVYDNAITKFIERVKESDVKAGTYIIVVSEGITDAAGADFTDAQAKIDSFGHKKLAGAGKYVVAQIEARMKKDNRIRDFMQANAMFVPGIYDVPELRDFSLGHLVRCGETLAFDVNFGMEAGAAAVYLLLHGLSGRTVVDVAATQIIHMPTSAAIAQRKVDISLIPLYEQMGFCFGRKPKKYQPKFTALPKNRVARRHL